MHYPRITVHNGELLKSIKLPSFGSVMVVANKFSIKIIRRYTHLRSGEILASVDISNKMHTNSYVMY
jgi:hypothetical protein